MIRRTLILLLVFFSLRAGAAMRDDGNNAFISDSLLASINSTESADTTRVNSLLTLTELYLHYSDKFDSAKVLSRQAYELSRKSGYKKGEAWSLVYMGKSLNENPETASRYFRQAGELFRQLNDNNGMAYTGLQNGVLMYVQNNFMEALQHFIRSKLIYESLKDESHVARLQHLSGLCYTKLGNTSAGLANLQSALNAYVRMGKKQQSYECRLGLADAYFASGLYEDALIYYRMCSLYGITDTLMEMSGAAAVGMANIFMKQNKLAEAESTYLSAYENTNVREKAWRLLPVTDGLYQLYESKGDYHKAFEYLKQSRQLQDTLYNEKNMAAMAGLKSERLLSEADSELLQSRLRNESDNRIKILLAGVLVVLGVVAYGSAWRYRLKKKMAQRLEDKNKALNLALVSLKSAEAQLIKAEKMAVFGKLSAGIAHEIRNPLNFITNFSELCQQVADDFVHTEDPEEQKEMAAQLKKLVDKIGYHGRRADSIVTRMLQHSRTAHTEAELTDLNRLADEFSDLAYESMRNLITNFSCLLEKQFDPGLQKVWLIPQDVSRVIINLLNNAFYAVNDKKHLHLNGYEPRVTVGTRHRDGWVELYIRDNGGGIPDDAREKIFEPFFTTKPIGEGTGLGLSICADIVKAAGGTISVESQPGDGATLTVAFPLQDILVTQKEPQDDLRHA